MILQLILLLLILIYIDNVNSQETGPSLPTAQVNGMMFDYKETIGNAQKNQINKKCFQGLGLTTCLPHDKATDERTLAAQMVYYKEQIYEDLGKSYCLQCCGRATDFIDHWNLDCEVDVKTALLTNLYGYEFRFARRQTLLDTSIVSCPLKRTACEYSDGETINCNGRATDTTFLVGYYLKVWVETHSVEGTTWQGVYKCEAESYESDTALKIRDNFKEIIDIIHPPKPQPWDSIRVAVFLVGTYFFLYCTLYFCRRRHCSWCTKKLVFSKEICWLCKLYGVEPPDPFILQALEEKALQVQGGLPPERFPGSRAFVDYVKKMYAKLPIIPNIPYIYTREEPIKPYEPEYANDDVFAQYVSTTTNSGKKKKKERQHHIKYPLEAIYAGVGHSDPSHIEKYKERVRKEIHKELGITVVDPLDDSVSLNSSVKEGGANQQDKEEEKNEAT